MRGVPRHFLIDILGVPRGRLPGGAVTGGGWGAQGMHNFGTFKNYDIFSTSIFNG